MSFEVFRKHQKKWMGALALMAMIAFTLDLSLFRGRGAARGNPEVFQAGGKSIRQSEVNELKIDRIRANQFVAALRGLDGTFGGTSDADMVDAYLLDQKGKAMGIPAGPDVGAAWLRQELRLPTEQFDRIYTEYFADAQGEIRCTDAQLLESIGRQVRILTVATLPDLPTGGIYDAYLTTPLDVYEEFKSQTERVSANVVGFPVADYVSKVAEPDEMKLRAYFDEHKELLPDPESDEPGFKIPRQVQVEYVMADAAQLEETYRTALTEEELRTYYTANTALFPAPPRELPDNLFEGDKEAKLTPRSIDPFREVSAEVRLSLAGQKARDEIERRFASVREQVMDPFLDQYDSAIEANREAVEAGRGEAKLPEPVKDGVSPVKVEAERLGLSYEKTPMLDRTDAELIMPIARAQYGSGVAGRRIAFGDYVFAPRSSVYEPFEMSDAFGQRYLGWKLLDVADRVPTFEEVKPKVVEAWKLEQARELAKKDAEALADQARLKGGDLAGVAESRTLVSTTDLPKIMSTPSLSPFQPPESRPAEIPELPQASDELREALFSLAPGEVKVEPNRPKTTYYVMTLNRRTEADLQELFGPTGSRFGIEREVVSRLTGDRIRSQLEALREVEKVKMVAPDTTVRPDDEY